MSRRIPAALLAIGFFSALAIPATVEAQEYGSMHHDYRVVTVVDGLEHPWGMTFLPGGDMLVTERDGRLRIVRNGRLLPNPVEGVPAVHAVGQGGLLDVVAHPEFGSNRLVYLTYSKPQGGQASTTTLIRGRFENDRLNDVEELIEFNSAGRGHYGSRIVFTDEYMFVSVGDRMASPALLEDHPSQDVSNHHGTVNRFFHDGTIPPDNPFVGQAGAEPSIWSYGHRNPQSLVLHPETGELWEAEHGPFGGDEVNLIEPGMNYGWPVVGYGMNYGSGSRIHDGTLRDGMVPPVHVWVPSIATSGMMIYDGDQFPGWRGSIFVGGLAGEKLSRLEMDGDVRLFEETLAFGIGRVRDVRQGPDGYIYLAIDDRVGAASPIVRLEPVD